MRSPRRATRRHSTEPARAPRGPTRAKGFHPARPLRILLGFVLAIIAFGAHAQLPDHGFLLVAKPSIVDPNFQRSVVLVIHVPDGAAVGVILNRPGKQSLASILPDNEKLARFTDPVHFGGPVERAGLFALFRARESPGEALMMIADVHLALNPATVEQLLNHPPPDLRLFAGYSGWAPDQLAGELARGDWWTIAADAETVFRKNTETLWDDLSRRARSITAHVPLPAGSLRPAH